MKTCPQCHREIDDNATQCDYCGSPLENSQSTFILEAPISCSYGISMSDYACSTMSSDFRAVSAQAGDKTDTNTPANEPSCDVKEAEEMADKPTETVIADRDANKEAEEMAETLEDEKADANHKDEKEFQEILASPEFNASLNEMPAIKEPENHLQELLSSPEFDDSIVEMPSVKAPNENDADIEAPSKDNAEKVSAVQSIDDSIQDVLPEPEDDNIQEILPEPENDNIQEILPEPEDGGLQEISEAEISRDSIQDILAEPEDDNIQEILAEPEDDNIQEILAKPEDDGLQEISEAEISRDSIQDILAEPEDENEKIEARDVCQNFEAIQPSDDSVQDISIPAIAIDASEEASSVEATPTPEETSASPNDTMNEEEIRSILSEIEELPPLEEGDENDETVQDIVPEPEPTAIPVEISAEPESARNHPDIISCSVHLDDLQALISNESPSPASTAENSTEYQSSKGNSVVVSTISPAIEPLQVLDLVEAVSQDDKASVSRAPTRIEETVLLPVSEVEKGRITSSPAASAPISTVDAPIIATSAMLECLDDDEIPGDKTIVASQDMVDNIKQTNNDEEEAGEKTILATSGMMECMDDDEVGEETIATPANLCDFFNLVGKCIGDKYYVERKLATGAMGTVYLAHQKGMGPDVAVKMLHEQYYTDPKVIQRFKDEARIYSKLSHPNIVTLHDVLSLESPDGSNRLCIIMEYLRGKTLSQYLATYYRFSSRQIIEIGLQIADALSAAHKENIIHRDLKAQNIMLQSSVNDRFSVKVLDFGIAKIPDKPKEMQTQNGKIIGTPEYMSPEQCRGIDIDHRTDIYAFGILMYQMICGKLPFTAESKMDVMYKQINEPAPPMSSSDGTEVPYALEAVVLKCLQKQPEERYQTFAQVVEDLTHLQEGEETRYAQPQKRVTDFDRMISNDKQLKTGPKDHIVEKQVLETKDKKKDSLSHITTEAPALSRVKETDMTTEVPAAKPAAEKSESETQEKSASSSQEKPVEEEHSNASYNNIIYVLIIVIMLLFIAILTMAYINKEPVKPKISPTVTTEAE